MFILDKPYVSDFLKQTVEEFQIPVFLTPSAKELTESNKIDLCSHK